jgi:dihydroorotate dehydrogenase electron transfer subunit
MQKNKFIKNCKILKNDCVEKDYFILELEFENAEENFYPGQFIEIEVSESLDVLLRRPFSIFDCSKDSIKIAYKLIGKGTTFLSKRYVGEYLNIIAPLGNAYPVNLISIENFQNENEIENVFIIGGGTGSASVHYLVKDICEKNLFKPKNIYLIFGFKSKNDIFCLKELQKLKDKYKDLNLFITTDDGSYQNGEKGFITDHFDIFKEKMKKSIFFMCGPEIIVKKMFFKLKEEDINFKMFGSFEEYMACGIGICNGCVIKIKNEKNDNKFVYKRVCKDGAIFNVEEVIWD